MSIDVGLDIGIGIDFCTLCMFRLNWRKIGRKTYTMAFFTCRLRHGQPSDKESLTNVTHIGDYLLKISSNH